MQKITKNMLPRLHLLSEDKTISLLKLFPHYSSLFIFAFSPIQLRLFVTSSGCLALSSPTHWWWWLSWLPSVPCLTIFASSLVTCLSLVSQGLCFVSIFSSLLRRLSTQNWHLFWPLIHLSFFRAMSTSLFFFVCVLPLSCLPCYKNVIMPDVLAPTNGIHVIYEICISAWMKLKATF